jgi:hypothetical protein
VAAALLTSRLVLAVLFAVAGASKLADPAGTRESMGRFGAPRRLVGSLTVALPLAELAVAGLLVPGATAWWGAAGALALLLVFSGAVARLLLRGEEADCHCFGALHSTPADRRVIVRNGGLELLASFVLIAGSGDAGGDPGVAAAAGVAAAVTVGACVFAWMLLRQNGHLLLRIDALESELSTGSGAIDTPAPSRLPPQGLPVGATLPDFAAHDLDGDPVRLGDLLEPGRSLALILAEPDCPGCQRLLPHLGEAARARAENLTTVVIAGGSVGSARAMAERYDLDTVLVAPDHSLNLKLRADALPSGILVGPDGRTAAELARGPDEALAMIREVPAASSPELQVVMAP